jgi:site-specific recombinase XerD
LLSQISQQGKQGKQAAPATSATDLERLLQGYRLFAKTEGKSERTIAIVVSSVTYLERFLSSEGLPTDAALIGPSEIRAFILHLLHKRCFSCHRFTKPQDKGLSGHTINCYLRSVRSFWSWLASEGLVSSHPFDKLKIPKAPRKVIPTFVEAQIGQLLGTIDISTPEGYRDQAIILTLLDTALRVSELAGITLDDLRLEEGTVKVLGKGNKERLVPIGKKVQRALWHYISRYRPEPEQPKCKLLFLTREGTPLNKDRIQKMMAQRGRKAGIKGVRCSPHTLRHTAAISFLRNGGDVFSLQRLLGHSSLEMTRRYCEVADVDVKNAHLTASPVDNLALRLNRPSGKACSTCK